MVEAAQRVELPPAHVGIHVGPVLFQNGDYYGNTVNIAARIADYARPGEVLVSQAVVEASLSPDLTLDEIGPVNLKDYRSRWISGRSDRSQIEDTGSDRQR